MEEKQEVGEEIPFMEVSEEVCPKCKAPMIRSDVSGGLIRTCFCRAADNYSEADKKRKKKEAEDAKKIKKVEAVALVKVEDIKVLAL
jgi:uncharacterized Zn finger protein (UPF0148 family)